MNLDLFKATLDTDARRRCEAQEKTIKEYRQAIKDRDEKIRALSNRCFALTRGAMCVYCAFRQDCPSLAAAREREAANG